MNNLNSATASFTVRDATIALLRSLGMTTIFGNPGSTELPLFKHWPADFRYILGLQEASAVAMADGYAQATRNAAFVNLHSAIGVGHALGSIFTAFRNQTPLVISAGQQARAMLSLEPYLSAREAPAFPKPYVKWSCEPARAEDVPAALARAYYLAMQKPCGPTFVSVPVDDWEVEAEPVAPRQVSFEFAPDPNALQQVADALNQSQRPALIVGPGVDRDGAWDIAVALAERAQSAVWASPMSARASFPEDHPLFAGFLPPVRRLLVEKLA
ncbi:MAG TPA: thiamine pyrophosphate-binding protein, partial [Ktedonobacterales bacterium]|nr:thiamine pyrophosphate-binding protein [Ktedonobacterales bacterium]